MFGTIRKHQTWLWAIIITLTIISFVYFFSPYQKMSNAGRGPANYGSVNGERVSEEDFANTRREVDLRYFFMSGGNWPDENAKNMGFDPLRVSSRLYRRRQRRRCDLFAVQRVKETFPHFVSRAVPATLSPASDALAPGNWNSRKMPGVRL